jgi:hypothetical protein
MKVQHSRDGPRKRTPEMTVDGSRRGPSDHLQAVPNDVQAMPSDVMASIERALAAEAARRIDLAQSRPGPGYRPTAPSRSSRMRSA